MFIFICSLKDFWITFPRPLHPEINENNGHHICNDSRSYHDVCDGLMVLRKENSFLFLLQWIGGSHIQKEYAAALILSCILTSFLYQVTEEANLILRTWPLSLCVVKIHYKKIVVVILLNVEGC